jgi:hypothetical protein
MKIKEVSKSIVYYVEIEEEEGEDFDFHHYMTDKNGENWDVLMGESWEPCYNDEKLKKLFWEYIGRQE